MDNLHLAIKKDFLDILPEEIDQIEVEDTYVKGSLVYKKKQYIKAKRLIDSWLFFALGYY